MKLKYFLFAFAIASMMLVFTFREIFRMFGLVRESEVAVD